MLDNLPTPVSDNTPVILGPKVRTGDWSKLSRLPPWTAIGSRDICLIYGVSMNTVCTWALRSKLPPRVSHRNLPEGNRYFYMACEVRAALEERTVEDICTEWALEYIPDAICLIDAAYCVWYDHKSYGVERSLFPNYFNDKPYGKKMFNTP